MVKNIFGSLSHGFFYFIGKVLAILFIGLVIYTLVSKIDIPTKSVIDYSNFPYYGGGVLEKYK